MFRTLMTALALIGCGSPLVAQTPQFPYTLRQPEKKYVLPDILREISGLTDVDRNHVACNQDELGRIFIYSLPDAKIVREYDFAEPGDYEGLTRVENSYYVLRSDGQLIEWKDGKTIRTQHLPLVTSNNEGLCYDPAGNRLLIAAKSKPLNHDQKNERLIYAYDLKKKSMIEKPVYSIRVEAVEAGLDRFNVQRPPAELTAKGLKKPFNFRPSSLAIHPETRHIYVISASDKLLVVLDRKGAIVHIESMNYDIFTKPEGITFFEDGTMIITNEAAAHVPTLLLYRIKN